MEQITLDTIKNISKTTKQTLQWTAVALCEEELLMRISNSSYINDCVLKGDIICLSEGKEPINIIPELELIYLGNDTQGLLTIFCDNGDKDITITSIKEVKSEDIPSGQRQRFMVEAEIGSVKPRFWLEIVHVNNEDSVYIHAATKSKKEIPCFTGGNVIEFRKMDIEGILVERYKILVSQGELIENMKAYNDIVYIANNCCLDGRKIREYLLVCGLNTMDEFQRLQGIRGNNDLIKRWKSFSREIKSTIKKLPQVIDVCMMVLEPVYDSIVKGEPFFGEWMPELKRYID